MKLAYETLMEKEGVKFEDLPQDAKTGIKNLKQIVHAISMTIKRGHTVQPATIEKLRANDKWVVREILDHLEEKDTNSGQMPNDPNQVIEEIENQMSPEDKAKFDEGVRIEAELESLHKAGKTILTTDELKSNCKNTYAWIFNNYTTGGDNGVKTTHYLLIEDKATPQTFNLKTN